MVKAPCCSALTPMGKLKAAVLSQIAFMSFSNTPPGMELVPEKGVTSPLGTATSYISCVIPCIPGLSHDIMPR